MACKLLVALAAQGAAVNMGESFFEGAKRQGALAADVTADLFFMNTSRPFVACFAPKTGCTLWKTLATYVNTGENLFERLAANPGVVHNKESIERSKIKSFPAGAYAGAERILVARNPYDRFLSAYLDWLNRVGATTDTVSFAEFADRYERNDLHNGFPPAPVDHIAPVSNFCDYERVRYVVLRVEEMDLWFDAVLERYDLDRFFSSLQPGQFYEPSLNNATTVVDGAAKISGSTSLQRECVLNRLSRGRHIFPRDDRSSKNEAKRVETDRERSFQS